jgi:hypothetical protein
MKSPSASHKITPSYVCDFRARKEEETLALHTDRQTQAQEPQLAKRQTIARGFPAVCSRALSPEA